MALLFSLHEFGSTFATRGRGAELREQVLELAGGDDRAVVIDFTDVTHVSYSFADEFVGKLSADHREDVEIELTNLVGAVQRTVRSAQQRRAVAC